jgi:DNA-binding LytR/AlgR family response regulator
MEQNWFPLRSVNGCVHTPLVNVACLIAKGSYTEVQFKNNLGALITSTESGCLKTFEKILEFGFIKLRRNVIVNRRFVVKHGPGRIVVLSTGDHFTIPKEKWCEVKTQLNRQMIIPFYKKDDSLNEKDDS